MKESPHIKITEAAWPHPVYTQEQMDAVVVAHREAKTMSDRVALGMAKLLRWGLDLATGYRHGAATELAKRDPEGTCIEYIPSLRHCETA